MKIIQILGPSYAGSTALGYALNTVEGYLFGSEIRRILPSFRSAAKRRPSCDLCGSDCRYWSDEFYAEIDENKAENLDDIYSIFAPRHPEVKTLVDSSKLLTTAKGTSADFRILTVKHPVRLLSSAIYNDRKRLKFASEDFAEISVTLDENSEKTGKVIQGALREALRTYNAFFQNFDDLHVFKNDRAHQENFKSFTILEQKLGLENESIKARDFSTEPCHSIGENRAPFWLAQKTKSGQLVAQPRAKYYENSSSFGDWKIDDKYQLLFTEMTLSKIMSFPEYSELCACLGYDLDKID